tara:strand:+ start:38 stop:1336 length:1299 start_codon:yes stop_codon:yes gene_type:complete
MNILQIEDDIKSLPDTNLMEAMQTGSYPQYLVLSELKRRKDMRDDHAGRMASYDKNNTVADKIMGEASMGMMNQGLGAMAPQNMQAMQGMPQNTPQMPVGNQGIGQMMPSNMQGMKDGRKVYPNAGLAALAEEAPEAVEKMGYSGGGIVEMAPGGGVPYTMMNPQGVGEFYDFYSQRMQPTQAELDYQQMMRSYFDPEEQKRRNKTQQGLNLVRAGLAVGTSATPEQLSKSLDPVISSAAKSIDARDKEGLMQAKFEADIAKQDRDRSTKISELAYKSEQAQKLGNYYDKSGAKDDAIIAIGKELAVSDPKKYAVNLGVDENNQPMYGGPNESALDKAGQIKGAGAIASAGIRTQGSQEEKAAALATQHVESLVGVREIQALVRQGLTKDQAVDKVRADFIAELKNLDLLAGGGKVPALPQDPPMLDMSSRF